MGQSTNDVFPTATRLAILAMVGPLRQSATELAQGLTDKSGSFAGVLKTGRTHLQDAVPITLGQEYRRLRGQRRACGRRRRGRSEAAARAESRCDGGRNGSQRRQRLRDPGHRAAGAIHRCAGSSRRQPVPRDAKHGGCSGVLGHAPEARRRSQQDRLGSSAAEQRPSRRPGRNSAAAGAAGLVHHAWKGESVRARNGQPGVLPGLRLRCRDPGRVRCRPTRTQRDDAGHRLERHSRDAHSDQRHARPARPVCRRHPGRRGPVSGAARPEHRACHSAQPLYWLCGDCRDRQDLGQDRPADPRSRA